ncbi:ElaB/YqjD/DUF883 family membrane-anchored ribosome-binding protein [Neorhizobium huautlense]|uniref:ElaB/YqjD/DUF883 family membrane-anchored ribosome-binding protein n=1 Tax=Neorhizobium huautlense TaxID=67774 RepID=A0ABT9PRE3_9HYPH|nr:hypothetical protein [Neorhizobium huautlense]MDP9837025.1 ElaB/YqjD/DUF883 family membrane-anchored ribosome-binding protein [Neorhizobium huautlense]
MSNLKSPSVTSLQTEQEALGGRRQDIDTSLEATFPTPDPITATAAGVPTGQAEKGVADAPRVDEALQSILKHRDDPYVEPREHAAALRDEALSLGDRGADALADVRRRIRRQPLQAIGIAALLGFVCGMVR